MDTLVIIMWAVFVDTMLITIVRHIKEMRAIKSRRQLLDEVVDWLHEEHIVSLSDTDSNHIDLMNRFCKRFGKDRF